MKEGRKKGMKEGRNGLNDDNEASLPTAHTRCPLDLESLRIFLPRVSTLRPFLVSVFRACRPSCHVLSFSSYVLASMFFHACVFVYLSKYKLLEYSYRLLLSLLLHSFPSFLSFMPFLQSFTGLFLSLPRLDVFVDKLVHIRQYVPLNIYIIFSVAKYLH